MPFLLAMDLPIGSEVPFQTNPQLPLDPIQLSIPMEVDSKTVESFDPEKRAVLLADTLPKQWCGQFKPFDGNPVVDVKLNLSSLKAMGQMVDLRGEMDLGASSTPVQGNLHAKSDQLLLIPLADQLIAGVEPGGMFLGLQDFSPSGWESPRLVNTNEPGGSIGGRLSLSSECTNASVPVMPLW